MSYCMCTYFVETCYLYSLGKESSLHIDNYEYTLLEIFGSPIIYIQYLASLVALSKFLKIDKIGKLLKNRQKTKSTVSFLHFLGNSISENYKSWFKRPRCVTSVNGNILLSNVEEIAEDINNHLRLDSYFWPVDLFWGCKSFPNDLICIKIWTVTIEMGHQCCQCVTNFHMLLQSQNKDPHFIWSMSYKAKANDKRGSTGLKQKERWETYLQTPQFHWFPNMLFLPFE